MDSAYRRGVGAGPPAPEARCGVELGHFIGEDGAGASASERISTRSGVALPRNACHSGSCIVLARTAARSLRSRYAHRCTTSLSWATSVWNRPTFLEYFSRTGMIALKWP